MDASQKNLTIKDWAEDDRPREKMATKGTEALSDAELVAILIGSGTQNETAVALAQRILGSAGNSLYQLGRFGLKDLTRLKGIGPAKAITLLAALELGRRRKRAEGINRQTIKSSTDIINLFQPQMADLPHEEFWVLLLNRANRIIETVRISQGGVSGTAIDFRIILKHAINALASGLIICHNHPSGNSNPSNEDISLTSRLKESALLMSISLLDHVIITDQKCYSFADNGMI